MRRLFQLTVQGTTCVGTLQAPQTAGPGGTAVLFLSFGQAPRAGLSDVEAFLADQLTEQGYVTLRVDTPGLGDAPGELPEDIRTFWRFTEGGGQQSLMRALVSEVARTFSFDGVVLAGLCAGAINSVYAADPPHPNVHGLVLFELPLIGTPPLDEPGGPFVGEPQAVRPISANARARNAISTTRDSLRRFTRSNRYTKPIRMAAKAIAHGIDRFVGGTLSHNANRPLIKALHRLARKPLPILLLSADPIKGESALQSILRRNRSRSIRYVILEGSNHMLNTSTGKRGAAEQVGNWLRLHFPLYNAAP